MRAFLPRLLRTLDFTTTQAAHPLAEALAFLCLLESQKRVTPGLLAGAPVAFVPSGWRWHVQPEDQAAVDQQMYTLCVVAQLQAELRKREVFVSGSTRWSDPRAQLLHGAEWETMRLTVCQLLHRSATAEEELSAWERELDAAYRRAAATLLEGVRIETVVETAPRGYTRASTPNSPATKQGEDAGRNSSRATSTGRAHERVRLHLDDLDHLPEPPSLRLRALTNRRLPEVDLGALLLEIEARTGFAQEFTHIGGGNRGWRPSQSRSAPR